MRRAEAEKENFMRENTEKSSALATRRGRAPELLIPASSLEVLKTAVAFGADAGLYRRRGLRPSGQGEEFFHGGICGRASPSPMPMACGSM